MIFLLEHFLFTHILLAHSFIGTFFVFDNAGSLPRPAFLTPTQQFVVPPKIQ